MADKIKLDNRAINILLLLGSLFFIFLTAEIILRFFTGLGREAKNWAESDACSANCYSSNPKGYFPISLKLKEPREKFQEMFSFSDNDMRALIRQTPYCIICNTAERRSGYFQNRAKVAIIVGDSFVYGEGVKEEDTLGYLLGLRFTEANFRNFGIVNASIEDVYETVLKITKEEKAVAAVIYFYNLNDVLVSDEIQSRHKYIIDFENLYWNCVKHNFITHILSKSIIYRLIDRTIIMQKETKMTVRYYLDAYSQINKPRLDKTIFLLASMNHYAMQKNIKFYVVIYPLLYKDTSGVYPFAPIHDFIKSTCKRHNIACIDAYPAFEKYRSLKGFTVHPVDYHPNGSANRLVVEYLTKSIDLF